MNRHASCEARDFKSRVSACSTTPANRPARGNKLYHHTTGVARTDQAHDMISRVVCAGNGSIEGGAGCCKIVPEPAVHYKRHRLKNVQPKTEKGLGIQHVLLIPDPEPADAFLHAHLRMIPQ